MAWIERCETWLPEPPGPSHLPCTAAAEAATVQVCEELLVLPSAFCGARGSWGRCFQIDMEKYLNVLNYAYKQKHCAYTWQLYDTAEQTGGERSFLWRGVEARGLWVQRWAPGHRPQAALPLAVWLWGTKAPTLPCRHKLRVVRGPVGGASDVCHRAL